MEIAPASVAVMVISSVSWFLTWPSSCASTPASSSWFTVLSRPVVTAIGACCGLRPVAKAFGCGFSMMKTRGIGSPAAAASRPTSA